MSNNSKQQAIEKFKSVCRNEFDFLLTEFGFREDNTPLGEFDNEFQIRFIRNDLTIVVEGIHYGSAAMVYLYDSNDRKIFPILLMPGFQSFPSKRPKSKPSDQIEDIKKEAQMLYQYGIELLKGDFSVFEHAYSKAETAYIEYESRRQFGIAEQRAITAFKKQEWSKVIEALEPYENKISSRMAKKLNIARENHRLKNLGKA